MKLINLKFKIIIGITLFIILICSGYSATLVKSKISKGNSEIEIGEIVYKGTFLIPVENFTTVTSKYGARIHPITKKQSFHTGIDLVGTKGSNILSVKEGEITFAGWQGGYGNCVEIQHTNEKGEIFYTLYAHMRDNSICVEKGQKVVEGQVIGVQGSTGNSTGDHLHFEIRLSDKSTIDPVSYLFGETN